MISLLNVTKSYGKYRAVTDLTLTVDAGHTVGFVGANGAGKTTTIRLMLGFLRPTAGSIHLMGWDMNDRRAAQSVRSRIGYVPDTGSLDPALTGQRLLDELAGLQNRPPVDRNEIVDALQLSQQDLRRTIGRLSRGTRQKINIVQGLQHRPELLILDEPTEGLDPVVKRSLFEQLQRAKARGATTFFSSHVLSDLQDNCDEVAIIRQGRLLSVIDQSNATSVTQHKVSLRLSADHFNREEKVLVIERLRRALAVTTLTEADDVISFRTDTLPELLRLLSDLPIAELTVSPISLEEQILTHFELR